MYAVVIPVPDDLTTALQPLRERFDPQAGVVAAHISILPPFDYFGPPDALHDHLSATGDVFAPIKVSLVGWDIHRNGQGYQLRLPVIAGRKELPALRNSLCTGLLASLADQKEAGHWPYIQFGQVDSHRQIQAIKQQLVHFEPQFIFRATGFDLLHRPGPNQHWQCQQSFGLMATLASPRRKTKTPLQIEQAFKNR
ncbi:MAG: hypothetical protein Kow0031_03230 [Anaerolineae bacterium]